MSAVTTFSLPDPAQPLDQATAADAFALILSGRIEDDAIAAFLIGLAERGETAAELAAGAAAMRDVMLRVSAPEGAIDVCGTGGDMANTLNISTAVGFVVAAAGVPVARHGNRAASSQSGVADILSSLGWQGDLPIDRIEASFAEVGIAFLHAQRHHPAMAKVAGVRRRIGRRTIFNLLGPLANPAAVRRQMIGVFARHWLVPMAEAARTLGSDDVLLAHGSGLDEVAVHDSSNIVRLAGGGISESLFDPAALGLGPHPLESLRGGPPEQNAEVLRALFAGKRDTATLRAYHDIVVANSAAALLVAGAAPDMATGARIAADQLASGAAEDRLARFIAFR
ncbi:MAG: anthranilate phosphoribosyltransferase [Sphingomonadaceae bacterium]